jgi:hypothetical protein
MNKTLSTTLTVIAVLVLAGIAFFAGTMYARVNTFGPSMMFGNGWNNNNSYSPNNMMNGRGPNMMNGYGYNNPDLTPLSVDQAKTAAEKYIQSLNLQGLEIGEVMIFDNNTYVVVKETETGIGAFELLVDTSPQSAYPEYGPNMMWNLKYGGLSHGSMMSGNGMMGGMMGSNSMIGSWNYQTTPVNVSSKLTVTPEQAVQYAQQYLDKNYAGAIAADDPTQFYGYYTLDVSKDGKIIGMLSVNGYSGQIFLHTWHGTFIEEAE